MSRRPAPSGGSALPPQNRQNEYFVPRDGIDREVIPADICRYLGNDALVRPGNHNVRLPDPLKSAVFEYQTKWSQMMIM